MNKQVYIRTSIWREKTFTDLSTIGKVILLFIITKPVISIKSEEKLASDIGFSTSDFHERKNN